MAARSDRHDRDLALAVGTKRAFAADIRAYTPTSTKKFAQGRRVDFSTRGTRFPAAGQIPVAGPIAAAVPAPSATSVWRRRFAHCAASAASLICDVNSGPPRRAPRGFWPPTGQVAPMPPAPRDAPAEPPPGGVSNERGDPEAAIRRLPPPLASPACSSFPPERFPSRTVCS